MQINRHFLSENQNNSCNWTNVQNHLQKRCIFLTEIEKLLLDGDDDFTVLQKTTPLTKNVMAIQVCPQSF